MLGSLLSPTAGVIVVWGSALVVLLFESRMENSIRLSGSRRSGSGIIALDGAGTVRVGGRPLGNRTALTVASGRVADGGIATWASGRSHLTCLGWLA